MIKVEIRYDNGRFAGLTVKGHAGSAPYGKDMVCAATSAITFGALNALEDIDEDFEYEVEQETGYVKLTPKKGISEHDSVVLETMILQLKTIEASYSEFIQIKERK